MSAQLKTLIANILDANEPLCLDSQEDKDKLVNILAQELTPDDYSEVVTIAEAIFPDAYIDETMDSCEVVVSTGLYNVAAGGDEPHLVQVPRHKVAGNFSTLEE